MQEFPELLAGRSLIEAFDETDAQLMEYDRHEAYIVTPNLDQLAGYVALVQDDQHFGTVLCMHLMYVYPEYRYLKLGSTLLRHAKAQAKDMGLGYILHSKMLSATKVLSTYSKVRS